MNQFYKIRLFDNVHNFQVGIFEYTHIPRIGEWLLTTDNDGSGDRIWIVDMVVYFPKYDESDSNSERVFIAVHATLSDTITEVNEMKKRSLKYWENKKIKVITN